MKQVKVTHYLFFPLVVLFTALFSLLANMDDAAFADSFSDRHGLTCKHTQSFVPGFRPVTDSLETRSAGASARGIHTSDTNSFYKSYVSPNHFGTTGADNNESCIFSAPFTNIFMNAVIINAVNQYLPMLDVIRAIFIPPKA